MTPFYQQQKCSTSRRDLFAILPFILLCFLGKSKLEPLTSAAQVKERGKRKRERERERKFHFMYQWFRTSFRANHTPIFVRVISYSDTAYIANWKTWQSELCLKGSKELGSGSPGFCQWSGKFSLWKEKLTCDQVSQERSVKSCLVWASPEDLRLVLQFWLFL